MFVSMSVCLSVNTCICMCVCARVNQEWSKALMETWFVFISDKSY